MSERLSPREYDDLVRSIWAFARVAMPRAIEIAPPPCLVRKEITDDKGLVELSVEVTRPGEHLAVDPPRVLQMAIGHVEPYGRDPRYQLWSYEQLTLTPARRGRQFEKGYQIFSAEDSTLMLPNTEDLPAGQRRRPGPMAWREIKTGTSFTDFGRADAERFRIEAERLALSAREFDI